MNKILIDNLEQLRNSYDLAFSVDGLYFVWNELSQDIQEKIEKLDKDDLLNMLDKFEDHCACYLDIQNMITGQLWKDKSTLNLL